MGRQDYTLTVTVDQTSDEVFNAINTVRGWWSENIEGNTDREGEKFTFRYQDFHRATFEITKLIPSEKVI